MRSFMAILLCTSMTFAAPPVLPPFPPMEFHPPKPERIVMPNGLVVVLLEDHELPLVQISMLMPGGSLDEPVEKIGLSGIMGTTWTRGGTPTRTPESIEQTLERKAAGIGFSIDMENTSANMSCRSADFNDVYAIFADLLLNPAFAKSQLELAKSQTQEGLRRMNDDPDDVTRREFRGIMYGRTHPYARIPSPDTIRKLQRQDLTDWHRTWIHPNGSILAVSGDFDSAAMKKRLADSLGSWARGTVPTRTIADPEAPKEQRLFYVQRPMNQTQIRIGYPGFTRHHADKYAWTVFNELWGGGGSSRLFQTVRTKMGLAYSVGSSLFEPAGQGFVVALSQTRGAQAISSAKAMLAINDDMRKATYTAEEVNAAKDTLINAYVQNFASSAAIASTAMHNEFFGYPADYIDQYPKLIQSIKPEDVQRVAKTYLVPEKASLLFVGDLSTFEKPLSTLGKPREIRLVDYTSNESFY